MSSKFISETEIAETRQKRQEEWERVRKPEDPVERPEEPYDSRSLYEKLQEQKQKKDLEYEEAHKLKNMIKGLDDDEIEFLDLVDRTKLAADRKKELEEELELNDYRNRVATLQEKSLEERLQVEKAVNKPKLSNSRMSQQKLLKGVVQIKKTEPTRKRKISDIDESPPETKSASKHLKVVDKEPDANADENRGIGDSKTKIAFIAPTTSLKCVGILPGLGHYSQSSDENSSDSDLEVNDTIAKIDMLGRKIPTKETKDL